MTTHTPVSIAGAQYQIGDAIKGRWQIRQICGGKGKSGMGIVYIVDDLLCQETLAVKTLQPHLISDEVVRNALEREANLWLAMGYHPNIVQLNSVETLGQQHYLFMDFVAPDIHGKNALTHYLNEKPIGTEKTIQWAVEMCLALQHMHNSGIETHRDIKPDNIMIDRTGSVRLTDFGLAVALAGVSVAHPVGDELPGVTSFKGIVGTPGYIAPEIIQGEQATVASDIYAFGLVLVQMLTGKPWAPFTSPWQGDPFAFEQANLRIRENLTDPLPGSLFSEITRRCLEFDNNARLNNFAQVEQAFREVSRTQNIPIDTAKATIKDIGTPTSAIEQINALYQLGRLGEALDLVMGLRKTNPDDDGLLTSEGVIRSDLGDSANALPLLQRACELSPEWCANWNNLGKALRACGRSEEALQAYEKAISIDDRHSGMWTSKGNCLSDLKRFEDALFAYDQALSLDGFDSAAHLGRAKVASQLGQWVAALSSLEQVFDSEPDQEEAHQLHDQCIQQLQTLPPLTEFAAIDTSNRLYGKKRYEEGLTLVREARLRLGPSTDLWNNEGVFLTELENYRGALRCFDRAIRDNTKRSDLWTNKGRVYRRMQQVHEALQCHDRAIEIEPNDVVLHTNKYACLTDLDLTEQAKNCFLEACKHCSTEQDRRHCRQNCADLYYLCMAEIAFFQKHYDEAHRHSNSIPNISKWYTPASIILGRSQYYIAMKIFNRDIEQNVEFYGHVVILLSKAKLTLQTAQESLEESEVVQSEVDEVCRKYVNAAYGQLVDNNKHSEATNLLALIIRYSEDDKLKAWSRQQLSVWLTNKAIDVGQQASVKRQEFIHRYSQHPYYG